MSYKRKIILILFFAILVPVILGSAIYFKTISQDLNLTQQEQVAFTARSATNTISLLITPIEQGVQTYGFWNDAQTAVLNRDVQWIKNNIDIAQSGYALDFGFTTDKSGVVLDSFGSETFTGNVSALPLLKLVESNETLASGIYEINDKLALVGTCQILDSNGKGEKDGYMVFGQYLTIDQLKMLKNIIGADISIIPKSGSPISTNKSFAVAPTDGQSLVESKIGKNTYTTAYYPLKDINGGQIATVAVTTQKSAILTAQTDLLNVFIGLLIGSIVLALLIGIFVSKSILTPINLTSSLLNEVASGDLTKEHQVKASGEIGQMIHSFNNMVKDLRKLIQGAKESAVQVLESSGVFTATTQYLTKASDQITHDTQDIASMSENLQDNVQESVKAIERISQWVEDIAQNTSVVRNLTEITATMAQNGTKEIGNSINQMKRIHSQSQETKSIVNELGINTQKVDEITRVITGIAAQTNLLALNAAIEAARAGEHGRGFSVVADEVKKLAEESENATLEIQNIIQEILKGTENAVASMASETAVIEEGVIQVEKSGQAFNEIQQAAIEVASKIENIAAQALQLAQESKTVVTQVEDTKENALQVTSLTQSITAATEEQSASMQELMDSVGVLNSLVEHLNNLTQHFRV